MIRTMNKRNIYNSKIINDILEDTTPDAFAKNQKRMLLAARIDEAIKAKGWKKNQFASKIGKTPSEISKWLSGTHNFTADTLFRIEFILDIQLFNFETQSESTFLTYKFSASHNPLYTSKLFGQGVVNEPFYISTYQQKPTTKQNE